MKKTKLQIEQMKTPPEPIQEVKIKSLPGRWDSVKDVIEVLQKAMSEEWSWSINTRCKYIDLKIDMRGHSCQIRDREGIIISIEKLRYQLGL